VSASRAPAFTLNPSATGPVILATSIGAAAGSKAAAAALACAGSEPDRAGLLIDLSADRPPRPSLVATSAARELEGRLAVHLAEAGIASRGATCHLSLAADASGIEQVAVALPLVRVSIGVVHLPPHLLQQALEGTRLGVTGALLVADLSRDRALTALAVRDLHHRGIRTAILKRPLGWLAARRALLGVLGAETEALPPRLVGRLLDPRPDGS
jgi:hypothetical protein